MQNQKQAVPDQENETTHVQPQLPLRAPTLLPVPPPRVLRSPKQKPQVVVLRQVDPGVLDYGIFNLRAHHDSGVYAVAKILSTNHPVGGYGHKEEAWRFSESGLAALEASTALQWSGTRHSIFETPLDSVWFPPEPLGGEIGMPNEVEYKPLEHGDQDHLFETTHLNDFRVRLGINLQWNGGEVTGTITWFHDGPESTRFLVSPDHVYWFHRVAADWDGDWREYHKDTTVPD